MLGIFQNMIFLHVEMITQNVFLLYEIFSWIKKNLQKFIN